MFIYSVHVHDRSNACIIPALNYANYKTSCCIAVDLVHTSVCQQISDLYSCTVDGLDAKQYITKKS